MHRPVPSSSDYMSSLPMSSEGFPIFNSIIELGQLCSISTQWSFVLFYVCVFAIYLMYFYKIIIKSVHIVNCKPCRTHYALFFLGTRIEPAVFFFCCFLSLLCCFVITLTCCCCVISMMPRLNTDVGCQQTRKIVIFPTPVHICFCANRLVNDSSSHTFLNHSIMQNG